jgi:hypothetical protein
MCLINFSTIDTEEDRSLEFCKQFKVGVHHMTIAQSKMHFMISSSVLSFMSGGAITVNDVIGSTSLGPAACQLLSFDLRASR